MYVIHETVYTNYNRNESIGKVLGDKNGCFIGIFYTHTFKTSELFPALKTNTYLKRKRKKMLI